VNVGRGEEQADCGNRVSMTLPTIPARPMDPERLRILCQETDRIKLDEVQTMDRLGLRWTGSLPMDDNTSTTEAAQYFRDAMEVARRQHARSWELRATMSLARLLAKQAAATRAARYSPTSTVGSPRASTPPTSRMPKRCSEQLRP
jgi:hypothetical protein